MPLQFVLDDIAESECDAIVFAAVPGAIDGAAPGVSAQEEREIFASLGEDEARITYANDLYCTYVIHVPCPAWVGDGADAERLAHVYEVCLRLAKEHDCRSVAFPLLGAASGYPLDEALHIAAAALRQSPMEVELLFDDKAAYDRAQQLGIETD